jgi:hypothetical protein
MITITYMLVVSPFWCLCAHGSVSGILLESVNSSVEIYFFCLRWGTVASVCRDGGTREIEGEALFGNKETFKFKCN